MRVKGQSVRGYLQTLETHVGADFVSRALVACPAELRHAVQYGTILPGGWYPIEWSAALSEYVLGQLGEVRTREIAHRQTHDDLKGLYRFVLSMATPRLLLQQTHRVLRTFYDGGAIRNEDLATTKIRSHFTEFDGFTRGLWVDTEGSVAALLEATGARDVVLRKQSGGTGSSCTWVIEWA